MRKNGFIIWPAITDISSANKAVWHGTGVSLFIAIGTASLSIASLFGFEQVKWIDLSGIFDALLFGFIGWGIHKKSRTAAILGLSIYIASKVDQFSTYGVQGIPFLQIIIIPNMFISSIRGTIAYHKYRNSKISKKNVITLNLLAILYSIVTFVIFFGGALIINPEGSLSLEGELLYLLPYITSATVYFLTLVRFLPFTKNKRIVEYLSCGEETYS